MYQIILLLLLGSTFSCASPSEAQDRIGEARWPYLLPHYGLQPRRPDFGLFPGVGILPKPALLNPAIRRCWSPFRQIPGCSHLLFRSSRGQHKLHLGFECCREVTRMSPECFYKIFHTTPFESEFGPKVKGYCTTILFDGDTA